MELRGPAGVVMAVGRGVAGNVGEEIEAGFGLGRSHAGKIILIPAEEGDVLGEFCEFVAEA